MSGRIRLRRPETRAALLLALGVLCAYLASAGGRIVASDEHTMFLLTQSLVERHTVAVPEGNGLAGPDGRLYPKAGLGQALASAPFYALGRLTSPLLPARLRAFYTRAVTSLESPFAGAVLALALVLLFLELGLGPRESLVLALVAALGTPLWVYAKLYLSEALTAAGLALELLGVVRWRRGGGAGAAALTALGFGVAVLTKYAILPVALGLLVPTLPAWRRWRAALACAAVLGAVVWIALAYNQARTGSAWGTGYGRQATPGAFTTPLLAGLYGLLLSSGKGLFWFAPIAALAPAALVAWWKSDRWLAAGALAGVVVTVLVYAGFEHWAGDGSWGPRYLVPLLPVLIAAVAVRLARRDLPRRRWWWAAVLALGVAGAGVQVGGVAIYYGAQMREAGDYPYRLPLDDPRFMSDSHWNPYFSPIQEHWRMLARNAALHARGERPSVALPAAGPGADLGRLGLEESQALGLTRGFDLWAAYAIYAGLPALPVLVMWLALCALAVLCWRRAWREAAWIPPPAGEPVVHDAPAPRWPVAPVEPGEDPSPMYVPPDDLGASRWSMEKKP
jgi:hypothetical protein